MGMTKKNYIKFEEELSFNAWPSYKTELYDDWLMGYSDFYTHRTNCVNIIGASKLPLKEKVAYCEANYKRLHTPSIFKINPVFHSELNQYLSTLDYKIEHKTDTYVLDLMDFSPPTPSPMEIELQASIPQAWIQDLLHLNKTTNLSHLTIVPKMYEAIPRDVMSACIRHKGRVIATGLGIMERDHIGIYAIYVEENFRGMGLAKSICSSLLIAAKEKGLHHAYLQVVKENLVAKKVYESLGFHYLYSYWFQVKHVELNEL